MKATEMKPPKIIFFLLKEEISFFFLSLMGISCVEQPVFGGPLEDKLLGSIPRFPFWCATFFLLQHFFPKISHIVLVFVIYFHFLEILKNFRFSRFSKRKVCSFGTLDVGEGIPRLQSCSEPKKTKKQKS